MAALCERCALSAVMEAADDDANKEAFVSLLRGRASSEEAEAAQSLWDPTGHRKLSALTTMEVINMVFAGSGDEVITTSKTRLALLESMIEGSERDGYDQSALRSAIESLRSESREITTEIPQLSAPRDEPMAHPISAASKQPGTQKIVSTSLPKKVDVTTSKGLRTSPPQSHKSTVTSKHTPKSEPRFHMPYPDSWEPKKGNDFPGYVMRTRESPGNWAKEKILSSFSSQRSTSPTVNEQGSPLPSKRKEISATTNVEHEKKPGFGLKHHKQSDQVLSNETRFFPNVPYRASTYNSKDSHLDKQGQDRIPPTALLDIKHLGSSLNYRRQEPEGPTNKQAHCSPKVLRTESTSDEQCLGPSKKRKETSSPMQSIDSKRLQSTLIYRSHINAARAEKGNQNFASLQVQQPKAGDVHFLEKQVESGIPKEVYTRNQYQDTARKYGIHRDERQFEKPSQWHADQGYSRSHGKNSPVKYAAENKITKPTTSLRPESVHRASSSEYGTRTAERPINKPMQHDTLQDAIYSTGSDRRSPSARNRRDRSHPRAYVDRDKRERSPEYWRERQPHKLGHHPIHHSSSYPSPFTNPSNNCWHCKRIFPSHSKLFEHLKGDCPRTCPKCNMVFGRKGELYSHLERGCARYDGRDGTGEISRGGGRRESRGMRLGRYPVKGEEGRHD